jgi:DNA-binding response OmpR family regulator
MGIDAFFDKPVAAGELVAKVEELLHRRGKEPER